MGRQEKEQTDKVLSKIISQNSHEILNLDKVCPRHLIVNVLDIAVAISREKEFYSFELSCLENRLFQSIR